MRRRFKIFRRILCALLVALAVIFGPYLTSRALSPFRVVSSYEVTPSVDATPTEPTAPLRVACYNIAHGRGLAQDNWSGGTPDERIQRLNDIAELLKTLDADVVILNEVDFDASWSNHVNQAEFLAEAAGYPYVAEQRNLDFRMLWRTWKFGNAVLSRHPITRSEVIDSPGFSNAETLLAGKKRGLACTIDWHGQGIRILASHLSHRSESLRSRSIDLLIAPPDLPTIIAGDLNSTPTGFPRSKPSEDHGNAIDKIDASGLFARRPVDPPTDLAELTFHAEKPINVIDWIMITHDLAFEDYRVIDSLLSDHRPIVADLILSPEQ
ncbi:endonuclease/exonuclease/phosphatase family protein [Algisphaera agarilytica]|uniref:Endonuclease/exonuclease/phosphatase family metal-dependent hydrolase n=1 Tax=Algisphaera agarilytica TaxID=1385975 RepID=A0A7X0LJW4_9BACT|nr:endonuclease/exonuclease/phosphatase family protein [Algisphaera agarilytica]MBB6429016.1 endonuclease/exonuclease/phosphatase family metal-dependent hydrolase [Algisphaera agarilytica]